ncbi:calcium-binding protein [Roseobacter weihaiensis]|uniref:calcium-binding protein n=1 Tax=Roseobacter weihaiensis TaxID=2763262 RepID=UPI001D0BA94A|nr:calcium-binding protein [Roseobacter sp. H9]
MARNLTSEELDVLRQHSESGDRIAYYTALESFGNRYGTLALGVVNNDTAAGKTANLYFATQAAIELGPNPVSKEQLATISLELMQADFAAREDAGGIDITVDDIQAYHDAVFGEEANVSVLAWTPTLALNSLENPQARQAYWDSLLNSGVVGSFVDTALAAGIDDPSYIALLIQVGATAQLTTSNSYGPYDVSVPAAGQMIGGNESDNTLGGSANNDVLIGFDGEDVLNGLGGDDRLYGGTGKDTLIDDEGFDLIFGGEDADVVFSVLDISENAAVDDYGGEAFVVGNFSDFIGGGEGRDTIVVSEFSSVRVGRTNDQQVLAVGAEGATDLAFSFETVLGGKSIDFTAYSQPIEYDQILKVVFSADDTLQVDGFASLTGTNGADTFELGDESVRIFGGAGDDTINGGFETTLNGGNGDDTFSGGIGVLASGGGGNDTITSGGGNSELRGGSGTDVLSAQIGDRVSGDANDTLTVAGVAITGDDVMFGISAPTSAAGKYRLNPGGENPPFVDALLSKPFAIMVEPIIIQFGFDGTQASIVWSGYIILNPSLDVHFDESGNFIRSSAAAMINFKMGDFGINSDGYMIEDRNLEFFSISGRGTGTITDAGLITGTIIDDLEDEFDGTFEEYAGVERSEFEDYTYLLSEEPSLTSKLLQLIFGAGTTVFKDFQVETEAIQIDGVPLDVNDLPTGVSVSQVGSDVRVSYGIGDIAVLTNIELRTWQIAATDDVFGTPTADDLLADNSNNLIVPGAGDDVIWAGGGNDTILYTSGNDTIGG